MTEHRSRQSFDDLLRSVLLETEPTTGAPAALRERVRRIPLERGTAQPVVEVKHWFAGAARLVAAIALLGVVGVVVALSGLSLTAPEAGGPTAPPTGPVFNPAVDGVGIVANPGHALRIVPWFIAPALGAVLLVVSRGRPRLWRLLAIAAAVAGLGVAYVVSTQPGITFGNIHGPGVGVRLDAPSATTGDDVFLVSAPRGSNFMVLVAVRNGGSLPVLVLGVVAERPSLDGGWLPRWTAVGMDPDQTGGVSPIEQARPFEPLELQPGEHVNLFLVGRAGRCALGPSGTASGGVLSVSYTIPVAISVLGLTEVSEVDPPFVVAEPQNADCASSPVVVQP